MRRFLVPIVLLGLTCISTTSSYAQRGVAGKTFILDDGSGNTLTLEYLNVPTVHGNSFYDFLPGGGAPTPAGTVNGQTLWWNNTTSLWVSNNFLTNTGSAIGIGTPNPLGEMSNTVDNNVGSDGRGINPASFDWVTNTAGHGYATTITNEGSSAVGGFDGLLVRVWDNKASTNALDISQGAVSTLTVPSSLFTVYANGNVNIDPTITAATSIGNLNQGTSVAITSFPTAVDGWFMTGDGAFFSTGSANIGTKAGSFVGIANGGGSSAVEIAQNSSGNNFFAVSTSGINEFGSFSSTSNDFGSLSSGTNSFGTGVSGTNNFGGGSVLNNFGSGNPGATQANNFGVGDAATTYTNTIGAATYSGATINNIIGGVGTGTITNYILGLTNINSTSGTAATTIGNSNAATTVSITGGNKWSVTNAGALTTVSTANIATGANLTNAFGNGGGTTTNNIGNNGTAATTTTNNIGGTSGSAKMVNGIGFNNGSGMVTNQIGVAFSTGPTQNQIGSNQGAGTITNYWGTSLSGPVLNSFGSTTTGSTNTYYGVSSFAGSVSAGGAFAMNFRSDVSGTDPLPLAASDGIVYIQGAGSHGFTLPATGLAGQRLVIYNGTGAAFTDGALHIPNGQCGMYFYNGASWIHMVIF